MFEHLTFRAQDHFKKLDSIFTILGMITILALAFISLILIYL